MSRQAPELGRAIPVVGSRQRFVNGIAGCVVADHFASGRITGDGEDMNVISGDDDQGILRVGHCIGSLNRLGQLDRLRQRAERVDGMMGMVDAPALHRRKEAVPVLRQRGFAATRVGDVVTQMSQTVVILLVMENTSPVVSDTYEEALAQLLVELIDIRELVVQKERRRLNRFKVYFEGGKFTDSARNLAHYLALRHLDLRQLQDRLARVGLSSLGHCESSILTNLDSVIELLRRAITYPRPAAPAAGKLVGENNLLEQHVGVLFGKPQEPRRTRIMVTLPAEAGKSDRLVTSLLAKGMNCARINCAHDAPDVWQAMIDKVRRASAATGRPCRILMDLCGHKLRTGELELQPAVLHMKVKHDIFGNVVGPADVLLVEESKAWPEDALPTGLRIGIASELHQRLQSGDRLSFKDKRGKERCFDLLDKTEAGEWRAWIKKSAYLTNETLLQWQRPNESGYRTLGAYPLQLPLGKPVVIRLFEGDPLLLTYDEQPGSPATYDEHGAVVIPARISCSIPEVLGCLRPGDPVWIDDGRLGAEVEEITGNGVLLRINHAGPKGVRLQTGKGINCPGTQLNLPPLTDKDLEDLDFVCEHADMVGFSFVETLEDMDCLIQQLARRGVRGMPIIAKVETDRAVKNLPEILLGTIGRHPLGVMIARGDLAVEVGSVRLAEIQEELLWLCEAAHVPVIWATQVLESLAKKGARSRPEFTDAAMGVRADCVMLNKGPYIEQTVGALDDVLSRMQAHHRKKFSRLRALHW